MPLNLLTKRGGLIAAVFKVHEIDQENGAQQNRLLGKIDSRWETDAEIVGVSERFLKFTDDNTALRAFAE